MIQKKTRMFLYLSPIACIMVILLFVMNPSFHPRIPTYFEITPLEKWLVVKGNEGQIVSHIIDYQTSISTSYSIIQFERGESMNFTFSEAIRHASTVSKGDTVGVIESSEVLERLAAAQGNALVARSDLAAKSTGEKAALVEEAGNKLRYSEARIREKQLLLDRATALYKKDYLSKEEYEAALWSSQQAKIEHEIAEAQLKVLTTGSKSEDLRVLQSTIDARENEIRLLRNRLHDFVITAPFPGEVIRQLSQDTLLIVSNTSQYVMSVPIKYDEVASISEGETVEIALKNCPESLTGKILSITKEVRTLNGIQILTAKILLQPTRVRLMPGLLVQGEIILPNVTLKGYLFSLFGLR